MNWIKKLSLQSKLMLITVGLTTALSAGALVIVNNLIKEKKQLLGASFETSAVTLVDAVAAQFYERYADPQAFALNATIQSMNDKGMQDTINELVKLYQIYDLVLVIDKEGKLRGINDIGPDGKALPKTALRELRETDFTKVSWFRDTLEGKFTEDSAKAFLGTNVEDFQWDPIVERVYGEKRLGNAFNVQIKSPGGEVLGVLSNRAGYRWVGVGFQEVNASLKQSGFNKTSASLLNRLGQIAFTHQPYKYGNDNGFNLNEKEILSTSLSDLGLESAKRAVNGESGLIEKELNPSTRIETVSAFRAVDGPKIIGSLGWSIILSESYEEAMGPAIALQNITWLAMATAFALSFVISFLFSRSLSKTLSGLSEKLLSQAQTLQATSESASSSSTELSESATEQAAAIQETAASIDEVSAMVKKNSDNSQASRQGSAESRKSAENGKTAVEDMMQAMEEIRSGNDSISMQISDSNRQISEITRVISEIGAKTKVINDIVFQTKLLSFNASVEAARAGEHGKGFAVVAEEVGNLAQMSGNAAKEISSMLDESIRKVDTIVQDSKSRVERLMTESKTRVESGLDRARRCKDSLDEILGGVSRVDAMIGEIAIASNEQSQGVSEINKAINQLDQATQQNTTVAQNVAQTASDLLKQSSIIKSAVAELQGVVSGSDPSTVPSDTRFEADNQHSKTPPRKVISFSNAKPKAKVANGDVSSAKVAVGQNTSPSADDPRFEDV